MMILRQLQRTDSESGGVLKHSCQASKRMAVFKFMIKETHAETKLIGCVFKSRCTRHLLLEAFHIHTNEMLSPLDLPVFVSIL